MLVDLIKSPFDIIELIQFLLKWKKNNTPDIQTIITQKMKKKMRHVEY